MQRKTSVEHSNAASVQQLLRLKRRILLPLITAVLLYYFSLPVLITWFPHLMNRRVAGELSFAWLFALSQFLMCGVITGVYMWKARRLDELAANIRLEFRTEEREYSDKRRDEA